MRAHGVRVESMDGSMSEILEYIVSPREYAMQAYISESRVIVIEKRGKVDGSIIWRTISKRESCVLVANFQSF